jgi:riboflavin kinase/FMN adenylyltransferase
LPEKSGTANPWGGSASAALTVEPGVVKDRPSAFAAPRQESLCAGPAIDYVQGVDPLEHADAGRTPRRVVAIGNFDGVHLGHQTVLRDVADDAARRGLSPAVLTFAPHPLAVLGRPVPPTLTSLRRKAELIRRTAPALVPFVRRFDLAFAAQDPEAFVLETLVRELSAAVVVVGQNFRFGHDRRGDFAELTRLGARHGFETRSHELVGDPAGAWSSSRARDAITRGDLGEAARVLGRPHMLAGLVVEGDRRGRTIGFPTCNLAGVGEALPPFGVYAVLVDREVGEPEGDALPAIAALPARGGATALATGVANLGVRPTVKGEGAAPSMEVHLFDTSADLYGARLRVHLVRALRPEQRFAGLDALKAQIARDATDARAALAGLVPDPDAGGAWR